VELKEKFIRTIHLAGHQIDDEHFLQYGLVICFMKQECQGNTDIITGKFMNFENQHIVNLVNAHSVSSVPLNLVRGVIVFDLDNQSSSREVPFC